MIGPRLGPPQATMLAFLTTDLRVSPRDLRRILQSAADETFNRVTVDDHASTNDTAAILASGVGGLTIDAAGERDFEAALEEVCASLAYQIAADGEGATKVVKVRVEAAPSEHAARTIARTIANSPLVKCAMHGNDPNWGRIVSAAGMAGVAFDPQRCRLTLQGVAVFARGGPRPFDAADLSRRLAATEVEVHLHCGLGDGASTVWTCDLSKDYVAINADYHT